MHHRLRGGLFPLADMIKNKLHSPLCNLFALQSESIRTIPRYQARGSGQSTRGYFGRQMLLDSSKRGVKSLRTKSQNWKLRGRLFA